MVLFIVLALLGLSIIVFPLHFHAKGSLDMYTNDGIIKGYFFIFRIFRMHLRFIKDEYGNNSVFIYNKKKDKVLGELHLNTDTSDKNSIVNIFLQPILSNINIEDLELLVKIGVENDAFLSAMSIAVFKSAYCGFMSFIRSWQHLKTYEKFVPIYNQNIFEVQFLSIFTFNIADVIYGLIKQSIDKKHKKKEYKTANQLAKQPTN